MLLLPVLLQFTFDSLLDLLVLNTTNLEEYLQLSQSWYPQSNDDYFDSGVVAALCHQLNEIPVEPGWWVWRVWRLRDGMDQSKFGVQQMYLGIYHHLLDIYNNFDTRGHRNVSD